MVSLGGFNITGPLWGESIVIHGGALGIYSYNEVQFSKILD